MSDPAPADSAAHDAALKACLLAVDPSGLGGASLRGGYGSAVDLFVPLLRGLLPSATPIRRVPVEISDDRLMGGLNLSATIQAGRPVMERGLLADADGGVVVVAMAERLSQSAAARLSAVIDSGEVAVERDGFSCRHASRIAVIALDEGAADDERPPSGLLDRLAFLMDLGEVRSQQPFDSPFTVSQIETARMRLPIVAGDDTVLRSLCATAAMIGVTSVRAPMLAMKAARVHAALAGRDAVNEEDAVVAARLVLAPRAIAWPSPEEAEAEEPPEQPQDQEPPPPQDGNPDEVATAGEMNDILLEAIKAAIPAGLLASLKATPSVRSQGPTAGRAGERRHDPKRGRPVGTRQGDPARARLSLIETLRAAAPWQALRRRGQKVEAGRVLVRRDDFRIVRFKNRSETATVFVVDASGSSALHRLAEAKGAVELLLADCYVRRDQVALIAFRGKTAELLLPPTRSLARAKRCLSALPGGGGTPMAAAIDAAGLLSDGLRRKGIAPTLVLLTDGRSNVARDGTGGRDRAESDALDAARLCRTRGVSALLVDTSPSPSPAAVRLAAEMNARYLALPRADAATISRAVRDAVAVAPAMRAG